MQVHVVFTHGPTQARILGIYSEEDMADNAVIKWIKETYPNFKEFTDSYDETIKLFNKWFDRSDHNVQIYCEQRYVK